jgi:hypothetical protein
MNNANAPAFARPFSMDPYNGDRPIPVSESDGLTKREAFAAMAMQGLSANTKFSHWDTDILAEKAIAQADALLAALANAPGQGERSINIFPRES